MFFMRNGKYEFDVNGLGAAHLWCRDRCETFMKDGVSSVVVSNTLTSTKELKPYTELAEKYEYRVVSIIVENRHGNKSIHDVPVDTLNKMEIRLKGSIKLR